MEILSLLLAANLLLLVIVLFIAILKSLSRSKGYYSSSAAKDIKKIKEQII